jgi:hypothetical protein
MGVIYIGDREVGKTHLALELASPVNNHVKVLSPDYQILKAKLFDLELSRPIATKSDDSSTYEETIKIQVKLPANKKEIILDWIDTPGEIWRSSWQNDNQDKWQSFINSAQSSEGIILVIPPYREMIVSKSVDPSDFLTKTQWINRFDRWADFFTSYCPKLKHLLFCLNKADLFCDYKKESSAIRYVPSGSPMNWHQRHNYVVQNYFRPVQPKMQEISTNIPGISIRCFITSIYDRGLLELPWIYLGSFLEN